MTAAEPRACLTRTLAPGPRRHVPRVQSTAQTGVVLARQLGLPGKGKEWDLLPQEYRVRELPAPAGRAA